MTVSAAGKTFLIQSLVDGSLVPFDADNAWLGVGNGSDPFDAADTDLQGGSKLRRKVEPTYPQTNDNVLTFRVVFTESQANFAWNEWALFNAGVGGTMFNRKVGSLGVKPSGAVWILTVELTAAIAS